MLSSAIYNKSPGIQTFVRGNPIFAPAATLAGPPVRKPVLPAHETALASPPVSKPGLPAHETALAGPPVSKPGLPAHETALAGPPVSRTGLPAPETASTDPPVSRTGLPAHEEGVRKYVVRRMIDNGWRGIGLETWQSLREHIHKE